jgi:hypothetical protein
MAVAQMKVCDWQGASCQEMMIENPTWEQIKMAIQALNNDNLNDLYLHTDNDTWLCVGGGQGQYLLTGASGDNAFPTLIDQNRQSQPKISLTVGGQTGDYPANAVHDRAQTLTAVQDFYDNGGYTANINWVIV